MAKEPEKARSVWNEVIGPFYAVSRVARELHLTEAEVRQQTEDKKLLGLRTSDENLVFPSFQFTQGEDGQSTVVVPGLSEVLSVINYNDAEAWTLASSLNGNRTNLDGKSIIGYLKETKDVEKPLAIVRDIAFRWSH